MAFFILLEVFSYILTSLFLMGLVLLMWRYVSKICAVMAYFCFIALLVLGHHTFWIVCLFLIYPVFAGFLFRFCKKIISNLQIYMSLKIIISFLIVAFIVILLISLRVSAPTIAFFLSNGGFGAITFEDVLAFFTMGDVALYLFLVEYFLKESVFCLLVAGILICFVISFIFLFIRWVAKRIIRDIAEDESKKRYFFDVDVSYKNGAATKIEKKKKKGEERKSGGLV